MSFFLRPRHVAAAVGLLALTGVPAFADDDEALEQQRLVLKARVAAHNTQCSSVAEGTALAASCAQEQQDIAAAIAAWREASDRADAAAEAERQRLIGQLVDYAKAQHWDDAELVRTRAALQALAPDGDDATREQVIAAWQAARARGPDSPAALAARAANGPQLPGAGRQSFQDCVLFALANAAGLPYGVVAARATALIRAGAWRSAAERADPQGTIEKRGVTGGEVVLLAEAFGEAEVVGREAFADTLSGGRPVLVNVVPADGDFAAGHELVLLATFRHDGATWYEAADSNLPPQQRLYLRDDELGTILQENGVAFRRDRETTVPLLR